MKLSVTGILVLVPVFALVWALTQVTSCQKQQDDSRPPEASGNGPLVPVSFSPAATQSASLTFQTSVKVYIKMVIGKKYGLLAHLAGKRDNDVRRTMNSPANRWWDNPMVVYEETPLTRNPDLTAGFDGEEIAGHGKSANIAVAITMVPHADIAIATLPKCDGLKGTITVRITAVSDYYDGHWTEMVRVEDKAMVFSFDTCDPSRHLEAIGSETRTVPGFAFERYTRDQEKWEPRDAWPKQPASGDFWTTIYGKDGEIKVTAYHYVK